MLTKVWSMANRGLEAVEVEVEVNVAAKGFPAFNIVGLPNKAVEEAKERVKTALINSGMEFPAKKITVNLAPADLAKEGAGYDLPIAVGIMAAEGLFELPEEKIYFYGEVGLDGGLRHTKGVFLLAMLAKEKNVSRIFVPRLSANEAAVVKGIKVFPVANLLQLIRHFREERLIKNLKLINQELIINDAETDFDFSEVAGQEQVKRALTIAAAGGHNVLMIGPPGAGKTMLSRALPGILPELTAAESLEVTKIYSVTGNIEPGGGLVRRRPFRSPHHTTSLIGLIGGGSRPMPGEISLAHRGVLFLDEFPEFGRAALEALRQPLEDGVINVVRQAGSLTFPAKFTLIAAANPCPCGFLNHPKKACICLPTQIQKYRKRLSGPILDRIDLHINVPYVEIEKLRTSLTPGLKVSPKPGVEFGVDTPEVKDTENITPGVKDVHTPGVESSVETSQHIREKVKQARQIQIQRFDSEPGLFTNSEMKNKQVKIYCQLTTEAENLLQQAAIKFNLSARSYFRLIKVSRTIADLAGEAEIKANHLAEALQYRIREEI